MRTILLFVAMLVFVPGVDLKAQNSKKITGSGNVVTKDIAVKTFDELAVSGVFSVILSQDGKEGLKIEAEDNLQELFEVKNEGTKLTVSMKKDINLEKHKEIKVYVTFNKLKRLSLKTVGNVSTTESLNFDNLDLDNKSVGSVNLKLTAQSLNMDNKSVGDVELNGKANNAVINNNSVGEFQAASFVVQKMDIDNNGVGTAEVNAEKELKVKDSMLNKVTNKGAATPRKMNKVTI